MSKIIRSVFPFYLEFNYGNAESVVPTKDVMEVILDFLKEKGEAHGFETGYNNYYYLEILDEKEGIVPLLFGKFLPTKRIVLGQTNTAKTKVLNISEIEEGKFDSRLAYIHLIYDKKNEVFGIENRRTPRQRDLCEALSVLYHQIINHNNSDNSEKQLFSKVVPITRRKYMNSLLNKKGYKDFRCSIKIADGYPTGLSALSPLNAIINDETDYQISVKISIRPPSKRKKKKLDNLAKNQISVPLEDFFNNIPNNLLQIEAELFDEEGNINKVDLKNKIFISSIIEAEDIKDKSDEYINYNLINEMIRWYRGVKNELFG